MIFENMAVLSKALPLLKGAINVAKAIFTPTVRKSIISAAKYIYTNAKDVQPISFGRKHLFSGTLFSANLAVLLWLMTIFIFGMALCDIAILNTAKSSWKMPAMGISGLLYGCAGGMLARQALEWGRAARRGYRHAGMNYRARRIKVLITFCLIAAIEALYFAFI
jgi:hypothetical protein